MNVRLEGAISVVRDAIAAATSIPADSIGPDDDLMGDLHLNPLEQESLRLVLEEVFGVMVPEGLWRTPLYRTATACAEWCIRASDAAAWAEAKQTRRCA